MNRKWLQIPGAFALGIVFMSLGANPAFARTYHVAIENMKFTPQKIVAHPGDTVIWINHDIVPHTVTENATGKTHAFDSGMIAANASFKLKLKKPGNYDYACSYHPIMKATIVVKEPAGK